MVTGHAQKIANAAADVLAGRLSLGNGLGAAQRRAAARSLGVLLTFCAGACAAVAARSQPALAALGARLPGFSCLGGVYVLMLLRHDRMHPRAPASPGTAPACVLDAYETECREDSPSPGASRAVERD